jgi:hypothetical protein
MCEFDVHGVREQISNSIDANIHTVGGHSEDVIIPIDGWTLWSPINRDTFFTNTGISHQNRGSPGPRPVAPFIEIASRQSEIAQKT